MRKLKTRLKKTTLLFAIVVLIIGMGSFIYPKYKLKQEQKVEKQRQEKLIEETVLQWELEAELNEDMLVIDVDGDGIKDNVTSMIMRWGNDGENPLLSAINYKKEKIGVTPDWLNSTPAMISMRKAKLDSNNPKESVVMEFLEGTHQSSTLFLKLDDGMFMPVCFVSEPNDPYDCLFNAIEIGGLMVEDLNEDGNLDVVEIDYEYPQAGRAELGSKIENTIDEVFGEVAEAAKRVAQQEQSERGRRVAWNIYSYNGNYFEPQLGDDYTSLALRLVNKYPDIMKKTDMSQESIEYVELSRGFWSHKYDE